MADPVEALEAITRMRERSLISEAEYQAKRAEILRGVGGTTEAPMAPPQPPFKSAGLPGLAAGLYEIEPLRVKLVVGRILGIAAGLALWWFVVGPMFGGDFLPTFGTLVVALFGGLWIGQMVTLSIVRGGR